MFTALMLGAAGALAADHIDSPGPIADPTADITDLYAWTNTNATKINLIMDIGPLGSATSFSDAVTYVFDIESTTAYGVVGTQAQVACEFYDGVNIECWGPGVYVTGDASNPAGISNTANSIKVFAGPRNDPFFMEFTGFTNAVAAVVGAGVVPNGTCPAVDATTSQALVDALTASGSPVDTFAGSTVQSLVVQVDKVLVAEGGPLLAIHASTYVKN
ncbi:MAG: DUF4331 family protein [Alphaproteobacteria bacterium]|nr:DUF4331 family protein [Alphaproteobacteria bacterium]